MYVHVIILKKIRYLDVIASSDMVSDSPVKGCMVIKPWGMKVWELMKAQLDVRITGW
jgi:prolyl-tRNA synthetase